MPDGYRKGGLVTYRKTVDGYPSVGARPRVKSSHRRSIEVVIQATSINPGRLRSESDCTGALERRGIKGPPPGADEIGDEYRRQDGDDGDDDQELNQGEAFSVAHFSSSLKISAPSCIARP
jgi:hypothetical protein